MPDEPQANPDPAQDLPGLPDQSPFLDRLSEANLEIAHEFGVYPSNTVDIFFLGFLRMMSRFGVFSFGPITIYVPTVELLVRRIAPDGPPPLPPPEQLVRFTNLLREAQQRMGDGPINELHALLAFMRLNVGVPGRVFGELGVRPEQVEEYARAAGRAFSGQELEKLYSPEEAAEYLGIHVQTLRTWIRSGRLRASRLTGQRALRIKASDLITVLEPVDAAEAGELSGE